jgi:signal transduction histidine kinase
MFHRLNGKSEYPGTGIGLAICRRIAQNHQGFITTESEPGNGATFNIFIPE